MRTLPLGAHLLKDDAYTLLLITALIVTSLLYIPFVQAEAKRKIERPMVVYKSPTCGCCGAWVDHMEQAGFSTKIKNSKDLDTIKGQLGVSPIYQACHTATHSGYVFEGHIPADVVQHFLAKKPDALGLTVPGMPMGSPGMDTDMEFRPYDVLILNKDGSATPYARVSSSNTTYIGERP